MCMIMIHAIAQNRQYPGTVCHFTAVPQIIMCHPKRATTTRFSFILRFGTITNDQHTNPSKYLQMFPPFLKATAAPQFRIRARAAVAARPPAQALPAIAVDAFSGVA